MRTTAGIRDAWHGVQVYDDDPELCASVSDYLAGGFRAGDKLLVVCTTKHWAAFSAELNATGHDVESARDRGQLVILDAEDTVSQFVRNSKPDERLFRRTIEPLLVPSTSGTVGRLRIYGEMVDLLCKAGDLQAAFLLEQLWNELHENQSFWLLCGYHSEPFYRQRLGVQSICSLHTHVINLRRSSSAGTETL
jgi:MEDS: MEthanogen/methylotroph, DcmR Sensory domain